MNCKTVLAASLLIIGGCSSDSNNSPAMPPTDNPPSISAIGDQSVGANMSIGDIAFSVDDDVTAAFALAVSVESDNPTLLNMDGLALNGSDEQRTLMLTPVMGQTGTATITVTVSDMAGQSAQTAFVLTVTPQIASFNTFLRDTFAAGPNEQPRFNNDKDFNDDESDFDDLVTQ